MKGVLNGKQWPRRARGADLQLDESSGLAGQDVPTKEVALAALRWEHVASRPASYR